MKVLFTLLMAFAFILTGCFEKKTRADNGSNPEYLEIINFISENNTDEVGNIIPGEIDGPGSSTIINSSVLIPIDKVVTISFSKSINAQTVNASTAYINDPNGDPVPAQLTVVNNQISIIPNKFLLPDVRYRIVITTGVKDIGGRSLEGVFMYTFLTEPDMTTAPTLLTLSPDNGEVAPTTTAVAMTFSEAIAGNATIILTNTDANTVVDGTTNIVGNILRFVPQNELINGTTYTASLQGTVKDLEDNSYEGATSWSFSIVPLEVDSTPPTLSSLTPTDGAIDVVKTTDIVMTFDENIANNGATLEVRDSLNNPVSGTNTISGNTLTFNPASDLNSGESYTVSLTGNVEDLSGNNYTGISTWSFTVVPLPDITPPTLISVIPADGAINVDAATDINVTFDEDVTNGGPVLLLTDNTLGGMSVAGISGDTANTLSFTPNSPLIEGHNYTIDIHGSISDLAGNVYTGETSWSFTVAPLVDSTPPNLTSLTPVENATNVDKAANIMMTFDENIANNGATLEVRDSLNVLVSGTNTVSANTLTFNPTGDLADGENYTVSLIGNIEDLSGNIYTGISTWSFTAAPLVDSTPPNLTSLTPTDGEINVDKAINMTMVFDETIADNGVSLEVRDSLNAVVAGSNTVSANTLNFNPTSDLIEGESYTATLTGNIEDLSGNIYTGISTWSFTVISLPTSMLTVIRITNDNEKIKIEFYEKLDKSVVTESDFLINGGAIGFSGFKFSGGDHNVEFTADTLPLGNEVITISGTVIDKAGNLHNSGLAADYNISGILSVYDVKKDGGNKITVKFLEISSILNPSTVNASDFLINGGAIGFSGFRMKNDYEVEFIADINLNGDELITISGDIQDMDGNFHNYGVSVVHTF